MTVEFILGGLILLAQLVTLALVLSAYRSMQRKD